jgi:hypothetical protein
LSEAGRPSSGGEARDRPDAEPPPGSPEERAADFRALKVFAIWFACCAAIAALYLALSIWIDWN